MKKILKRFFYFLTGFIAILVSLNLYLEVVGVPNRIKNDLLKDLSNEDVTIHAERMYASIFSGVILDNATITAPLFGEKPLIKARNLQVEMNMDFHPEDLRIEGGNVRFPLSIFKTKYPLNDHYLNIENIHLDLDGSGRLLIIHLFSRNQVRVSIKIDLNAFTEKGSVEPLDIEEIKSAIDDHVQKIEPLLQNIEDFIVEAPSNFSLQLNIHITKSLKHDAPKIHGAANITNMNIHGYPIHYMVIDWELIDDELKVQQFQLSSTDDQYINAVMDINLNDLKLDAFFRTNIYPSILLNIMDMEQRLNELVVPIHKASKPILLNLDIKGLNLKNLLEGKVHFDFQAEEFGLNMLPVQIGQASGSYTGGKINFDKIFLQLDSGEHIKGEGYFDFVGQTMVMRNSGVVDPMVATLVYTEESFIDGMKVGLDRFEFSKHSPPNIQMQHFLDYSDPDDIIYVLTGDISAEHLKVNNVDVSAMSAEVMLDIQDFSVLVNDINVYRDAGEGKGQLMVYFDEVSYLHYDVESTINSIAILRICDPILTNILKDIDLSFPVVPYIKTSGFVDLTNLGKYDVSAIGSSPECSWQSIAGKGVNAKVRVIDNNVQGAVEMSEARYEELIFTNAALKDFSSIDGSFKSSIQADKLNYKAISGSGVKLDLFYKEGESKELIISNISLDNGQVKFNERSALSLKNAIIPEVKIQDKKITCDGKIGEVKIAQEDKDSIVAAHSSIHVEFSKEIQTVNLKAYDIKVPLLKGSSKEAKFKLEKKDKTNKYVLLIPEIEIEESENKIKNVTVFNKPETQSNQVSFKIEESQYNDIKLTGVSGDLTYIENATKCENLKIDKLDLSILKADNIEAKGIYAFDAFYFNLDNSNILIENSDGPPLEFKNLSSEISFLNKSLFLRDLKAKLNDGEFEGAIKWDTQANKGYIAAKLKKAELAEFAGKKSKEIKKDLKKKNQDIDLEGTISSNLLIGFSHDAQGGLELNGDAHVTIKDAPIWQMPVVYDFFGVVNKIPILSILTPNKEVAKISAIEADLTFENDMIRLSRLQSDGSIVSLTANGYYWWKTKGIDLRFRADGLFNRFIVRRMVGTSDNYEWESMTAFKDLFRDSQKPVDPTIVSKNTKSSTKKKKKKKKR